MSFSRFFFKPKALNQHLGPLGGLALLGLALLLSACSPATSPSASNAPSAVAQRTTTSTGNPPGPRSGGAEFAFVQTTTATNTIGDRTELNCPPICNISNRYIMATPVIPSVVTSYGAVVDTHPLGAWYDPASSDWTIFNEDQAPMPVGALFNVYMAGNWNTDYTVTASSAVSSLWINDPTINGQPGAGVFIMPLLTDSQVYDPHPLYVFYSSLGHWTIAHEDGTALPAGASYIVQVNPLGGVVLPHQTATTSNTSGSQTLINDSRVNFQPGVMLFLTQYAFPANCLHIPCLPGSPHNTSSVGVVYNDGPVNHGFWGVTNLPSSPMPIGAIFEIFLWTGDI